MEVADEATSQINGADYDFDEYVAVAVQNQSLIENGRADEYVPVDGNAEGTDEYGMRIPPLETSQLSVLDNELLPARIKNGGFKKGTEHSEENLSVPHWEVKHGNTHSISFIDEGIDGRCLGTSWKANAREASSPSISQTVDLDGVSTIGLDVGGSDGNPHRSEIVLEVDGERQGTFIKAPRQNTLYRDLGVEIPETLDGEHTITIKWIQIAGDNVGNSYIDNVRAYKR
jgi:hypothetical protein